MLLWRFSLAPWENEYGITTVDELRQVYQAKLSIYLESHRIGTVQSIYNFATQF